MRPTFERLYADVKCVYFHNLQRLSSGMSEIVGVINQDVNNSMTASNMQATIEGNRKTCIQHDLKEEEKHIAERRGRTVSEILTRFVKEESVMDKS